MENIREETVGKEKEKAMNLVQNDLKNQNIMRKRKGQKKGKKIYYFIPKFGCIRINDVVSASEKPVVRDGIDHLPTHLVIMLNGILGSADNWRYAAKQFMKAYPNDVVVHCSESNHTMLTFDGVDVMGKRLADEVISVVDRHPQLQKISFVGHSLGGLIARYAVAILYQQNESPLEAKPRRTIAGLDPVNFITFATPHLGSRGHKQVPLFCGFYTMERLASRASGLLGRTGKHLFLRDCDDGKPPLLLRMSNDSEDLKFISALQSFRRRVAYSNVRFDHIELVGWSSSSLRRRNELPKRRSLLKNAKYPHILYEEKPNTAHPQEEVSLEAKIARGRTKDMEETMIRGLTRMNWERVDVDFSGSIQRFVAHGTIQMVKCNYILGDSFPASKFDMHTSEDGKIP